MPSFWGKLASWNEKLYLASESRTNTAPLPALLKRSPKHVDQVVRRDAPFLLSDLVCFQSLKTRMSLTLFSPHTLML